MFTMDFKYCIGETVKLTLLGGNGRVLGFRCFGQGPEYNVRYFNNGEEKSVWFYEEELEHLS